MGTVNTVNTSRGCLLRGLELRRTRVSCALPRSAVFPTTRLGLPEEFAQMAVAILENRHLGCKSLPAPERPQVPSHKSSASQADYAAWLMEV